MWSTTFLLPAAGRAEIAELVVRMARENSGWGYDRIAGALQNLSHNISDQTVGNILRRYGISPAPKRRQQLNGQISFGLIWQCWQVLISSLSKYSPGAAWSPPTFLLLASGDTTCYSRWNHSTP